LEELEHYLASTNNKPHIICIQETHLKSDSNISIPGYSGVHNMRETQKGGGTSIFVVNGLCYQVVALDTDLEVTKISIKIKGANYFISSVYIPPCANPKKQSIINLFIDKNTIVTGDFNAKNSLWGSPVSDHRGKLVHDVIEANGISCLNTGQGTHLNRNGTLSHLDLSFVSSSLSSVCTWKVLDDNLGSDHFPTIVFLNALPSIDIQRPPKWNHKKANWPCFTQTLNSFILPSLDDPILSSYNTFTDNILTAAKNTIPVINNSKGFIAMPYWTKECSDIIHSRKLAVKTMRRTNNLADCITYRSIKAKAQYTIKLAKRVYWEKYCGTLSTNTKVGNVWKVLRNVSGAPYISSNFNLTGFDTDIDKANAFAKVFDINSGDSGLHKDFFRHRTDAVREFLKEKKTLPDDSEDLNGVLKALNSRITITELNQVLNEKSTDPSPGSDNITLPIIRNLPLYYKEWLVGAFNIFYDTGTLPPSWNHSIVNPILKAGKDSSLITSYRPISLSSNISKLMEKIIRTRLYWFCESQKIFTSNQSGFRKCHSTIDQVARVVDDAEHALETNNITVAIFLDFTRAFDLVWKDGIIIKLRNLHINGNMLKYIQSFLANRTSEVRIGNSLSDIYVTKNGTPQGCAISPLLFSIYINDFPNLSQHTKNSLFADDSGLWRSGSNLSHICFHLQQDLDTIETWCNKWGFVLNGDKSTGIVFTKKHINNSPTLSINNVNIPFQNAVKYLGIYLDSQLTWTKHIDYVVDRCKPRLNLLRSIAGRHWGATQNTLLAVYRSLIRSICDYGSILFQHAANYNLNKLSTIQYKSLLTCLGAMKGTSLASLLIESNELPFHLRTKAAELKYLYKIKSTSGHAASCLFIDQYDFNLGKKFKSKYRITWEQANETIQFFTSNNIVPVYPPWIVVQNHLVDLTLESKYNKDTTIKNVISTVCCDYITSTFQNCTEIYTDASISNDGHTGLSVVVHELGISITHRSSDFLSSYTVELLAIRQALYVILENNILNPVILSDSYTVLRDLRVMVSNTNPTLMLEVCNILTTSNLQIRFCYIPGHCNIPGNSEADFLAKEVARTAVVTLPHDPVFFELLKIINKNAVHKWKHDAQSTNTAVIYRMLFPEQLGQTRPILKPRRKQTLINRLRLQQCGLNFYLNKIGVKTSPLCDQCHADETVNHFLLECPKHLDLTSNLTYLSIKLHLQLNVATILTNNEMINVVYEYVKYNNLNV
jgi:ribonuclease HI